MSQLEISRVVIEGPILVDVKDSRPMEPSTHELIISGGASESKLQYRIIGIGAIEKFVAEGISVNQNDVVESEGDWYKVLGEVAGGMDGFVVSDAQVLVFGNAGVSANLDGAAVPVLPF